MKKILAMCLALGVTFGSFCLPYSQFSNIYNNNVVNAETNETQTYYAFDNFKYTLADDGTAVIVGYMGGDTADLIIPSKINGIAVKCVTALKNENSYVNVQNIIISEGITEIGENAFAGYTQLKSVSLPESLTVIGSYAFKNCQISEITIPGNVKTIGAQAFRNCESLKNVIIENGVINFDNAFWDCDNIENITIPKSVRRINFNYIKPEKTVIICEKGSYAERCAAERCFVYKHFDGKYIGDCEIILNKEQYKPNEKPKVTIKDGDNVLKLNKDYVLRYDFNNNFVVISGRGEYSGMTLKHYNTYTDISNCEISLSKLEFKYTGKTVKPRVIVKDKNGSVLKIKKDYNIRYVNNINTGKATVVISGVGSYNGSVQRIFTITK